MKQYGIFLLFVFLSAYPVIAETEGTISTGTSFLCQVAPWLCGDTIKYCNGDSDCTVSGTKCSQEADGVSTPGFSGVCQPNFAQKCFDDDVDYETSKVLCITSSTYRRCSQNSTENAPYFWFPAVPADPNSCSSSETCNNGTTGSACTSSVTPPTTTTTTQAAAGGGAAASAKAAVAASKNEVTLFYPFLAANEEKAVPITNVNATGVSKIIFTPILDIGNSSVIVKKLDAKPVVEGEPGTNVYRYYEFKKSGLNDIIIKAVSIEFAVDKAWITGNNIDPAKVSLARYSNGVWSKLATTKLSEDDAKVTYVAQTPGFSYFAVVGEEVVEQAAPAEAAEPAQEEAAATGAATAGAVVASPFPTDVAAVGAGIFVIAILGFVKFGLPVVRQRRVKWNIPKIPMPQRLAGTRAKLGEKAPRVAAKLREKESKAVVSFRKRELTLLEKVQQKLDRQFARQEDRLRRKTGQSQEEKK